MSKETVKDLYFIFKINRQNAEIQGPDVLFFSGPSEWRSINGSFSKAFFDSKQLIVFGHSIRSGGGTRFDLTAVRPYCDISYRGIFCLS
jgi:hypothetical protein